MSTRTTAALRFERVEPAMDLLARRLQKIKATGAIKVERGGYWYPVAKVRAAAEEHAR